jgi:hypothetical protein
MDDFSCFLTQFLSIFDWLDSNKTGVFLGAGLFLLGIVLLMVFASLTKKKNTHD